MILKNYHAVQHSPIARLQRGIPIMNTPEIDDAVKSPMDLYARESRNSSDKTA